MNTKVNKYLFALLLVVLAVVFFYLGRFLIALF